MYVRVYMCVRVECGQLARIFCMYDVLVCMCVCVCVVRPAGENVVCVCVCLCVCAWAAVWSAAENMLHENVSPKHAKNVFCEVQLSITSDIHT